MRYVADDKEDDVLKLPLIYLMDCTLNDCSNTLKSLAQRELYPSLLLFPAEKKDAVFYGGDMTIIDIIKFMVDHGSNSQSLVQGKVIAREKSYFLPKAFKGYHRDTRLFVDDVILNYMAGILWTGAERGGRDQNLYKEAHLAEEKYHVILLKDRTPKISVRYSQIRPRTLNVSQDTSAQLAIGSILTATDKLLNVHPFDKSKILIVKVNRSTGFQGLMINKNISWDSLEELGEGLEVPKELPLSFGGPVMKRGMPLVSLARNCSNEQCMEVLPNIYFLDQWATLHAIEQVKSRNQSMDDYWFFVGYSSWGWDQLFDEIAEGAWSIRNGDLEPLDWPWR
ncbi:unnamed protein product [Ilex paraguariensis]|uniref:Transcriptional regulator n=1 Tax=Ilex paraguariensis TaxID=185542 RepID=A0ABC8RB19_9AQUA